MVPKKQPKWSGNQIIFLRWLKKGKHSFRANAFMDIGICGKLPLRKSIYEHCSPVYWIAAALTIAGYIVSSPIFWSFLVAFTPNFFSAQDADGCDWTLARATQGITLWWGVGLVKLSGFLLMLADFLCVNCRIVCCTIHPRSWDQPDRHGEPIRVLSKHGQ
jgi:hypothetical protein